MPQGPVLQLNEVFVPGGRPTVTYIPRDKLGLEGRVNDFLLEGHRILSVSGPTKSGKTVLLKSLLNGAVWLSGGNIGGIDQFWEAISDHLGAFTGEERSQNRQDSTGQVTAGELGVGPFAKGSHSSARGATTDAGGTFSRNRSTALAALDALERSKPVLVIDDFHYVDPETQLAIVRGLKDLVFEGLKVIVAAVPHRAYDAVRVEKEMTGRVEQLPISFWSKDELIGIASGGFVALNAKDSAGIAKLLAGEAFGSPHLMQDFCLQLCKFNKITQTLPEPKQLSSPLWSPFFAKRATAASKSAFDLLARGPRQRADRKERTLVDSRVTDIYGVVLAAIARTGPLTELPYEELRSALREVVYGDPPRRSEVTRVLEEMSKIAKEQIAGEPVVDFDAELGTLFISDPFFAYFLRWGLPRF